MRDLELRQLMPRSLDGSSCCGHSGDQARAPISIHKSVKLLLTVATGGHLLVNVVYICRIFLIHKTLLSLVGEDLAEATPGHRRVVACGRCSRLEKVLREVPTQDELAARLLLRALNLV